MDKNKFNLIFITIDWNELIHLTKIYQYVKYSNIYYEYKECLDQIGLELIGTYEPSENKIQNLMYYEDNYKDNIISNNYLMSLDDMVEFYKDNFAVLVGDDYKIAIFGSKNKFNFIKTYEFNIFISKLGELFSKMETEELKHFDENTKNSNYIFPKGYFNSNFNFCCVYKTLSNVKLNDNKIFMIYDE